MNAIFLLLILFQVKHFVADFPLQGKYMLRKFLPNWGFFFPLLAHSSIHALFTFLIALCVKPEIAVMCGLLDLVIHFTMDRIKAGPKYLGRFKTISAERFKQIAEEKAAGLNVSIYNEELKQNTYFWWSLGIDQSVHHLTHYFIIYLLVR